MNVLRCAQIALVAIAICIFGVRPASSQNLSSQNLSKQWVEQAARPLIDDRIADGLSIGFIEGDQFGIVHLGSANEKGQAADYQTIYEIGSITKVFTGILLADAANRGEINLSDPADTPNAAGIELPSRDGRSIKWIDLSTHRSGLPRLPANLPAKDLFDPYRDYDSNKAAAFLNDYKLPRAPGAAQEYSNLGGSVLGYLLAQKLGKSYDELLRERIATPLKMADSTTTLTTDQTKRFATPHASVGSSTSPWSFADLPGAGGIHSTMRDMMRFAKAQLNPPPGPIGEAIELAWKQHSAADASGPATGLGWMIAGDGETRWHNGGTGGFRSAIFINRSLKSAVIVLCNTGVNDEVDQLAARLIQKAAGIESNPQPAAGDPSPPKLSPFTAVRFDDDRVLVTYDGKEYQWLAIDTIKVDDLVASAKAKFGDRWQKRVSEDLVEVLWSMDHRPGDNVKLRLRDIAAKRDFDVEKAPMTSANRSAVRANQERAVEAAIDANLRRRLVGRYQLAPNFIFDVQDRDGRLVVGITNQPTQEVFPDSPTRWSYRGVPATLEFKLPKTGRARSLILHQNGMEQTARRME